MQLQQSHDRSHQTVAEHPSDSVRALFYVVGDADPSFLPRVFGPVAKLGHMPSRVHASTEAGDGTQMTIDLRVTDISQTAAKRVENALRSIVGVHQVIAVYENNQTPN
jgi:hypothetical protein